MAPIPAGPLQPGSNIKQYPIPPLIKRPLPCESFPSSQADSLCYRLKLQISRSCFRPIPLISGFLSPVSCLFTNSICCNNTFGNGRSRTGTAHLLCRMIRFFHRRADPPTRRPNFAWRGARGFTAGQPARSWDPPACRALFVLARQRPHGRELCSPHFTSLYQPTKPYFSETTWISKFYNSTQIFASAVPIGLTCGLNGLKHQKRDVLLCAFLKIRIQPRELILFQILCYIRIDVQRG